MFEKEQDRPPEFITAGHICLDVIPTFHGSSRSMGNFLVPGKLVSVGKVLMATGGSVANTGLALHRLGASTRLLGKVGADKFGETILEILGELDPHLVSGMIVDAYEDTSYTIVISPPGLDRFFLHNPGANDTFQPDTIDVQALTGSRFFHFGYPPVMRAVYRDGGDALASLLQRVKDQGLTTSLDMSYPDPETEPGGLDWRAWLRRVLPHVDIFLPSFDEILFMLERPAFDVMSREAEVPITAEWLRRLADTLLDMGVAIVVLKLGDKGLYMKTTADRTRLERLGSGRPDELAAWQALEHYTPCFECDVAGTTGAGDCTIAGFLAALSKGLAPRDVMTMAVAVGGFNVESADATSGIPHWNVVRARVQSGWPKHEEKIVFSP